MRGSVLHPSANRAIHVGIIAAATVFFLVGVGGIRLVGLRPPKQTEITTKISGIERHPPAEGDVYWMDVKTGKVPVIGSFTTQPAGGRLTISIPDELQQSDQGFIGLYWPAGETSYVPHMHFLFDTDLRDELDTIMHAVWRDAEVRGCLAPVE